MSKQILVAFLVLGVLATSNAFASRARQLVMGTGDASTTLNGGSLYYDETYNIFYNPSYVNNYKNWAIIEKSNFSGTAGIGTTAQGGFSTSIMNFETAFYFNRGNAVFNNPNSAFGTAPTGYVSATPVRPFDLFVGGDVGFKWGLGLTYGSNATTAGTSPVSGGALASANSTDLTMHLGAQVADLEPFLSYKLSGKETTTAGDATHNFMRVGTRYHVGDWTPYAALTTWKDQAVGAGSAAIQETTYGAGLGRSMKLTEGLHMHYAASLWRLSDTGGTVERKRTILPLDFSVEGEATSWLTLRGGVGYRLADRLSGSGAGTVGDMTTGRIGASVHVSKVDVDWAIGKAAGTAEAAADANTQSFDISNNFFTAASVAYRW